MKKFLLHILVFGTIVIVLAFVVDFFISNNLRKPTGAKMMSNWNAIYSGDIQSDVIIMGNSRAWVQYSPQILDSILEVYSWNLGIDGSCINRQIIAYDTYRRFNPKPKYIIQNIDFSTLGITSGFQKEQFLPYFFDDSLRTAVSEYEDFNFFGNYFPLWRYIGYRDFIRVGLQMTDFNDGCNVFKGYQGVIREWNGAILAEQTEINYSQDSAMLVKFDNYLASAYSQNIKVIFVYAPVYIEATKKIKNIEGMYAMYDSIAQKYDIPILDYNYDAISYDTTYFYNATHLNKKGAELFSTKLAHDIDSLGILRN
ncbi:MAG: hypothetical protein LBM68_00805 [Bacteroidales bacterium]|jgi:hypothetical protein|nr:hypothetical protein [Bacteroidales bacterium]